VAAVPVASQVSDSPSSPTDVFADRVDVELVTVDVWVADEQGTPVTALHAADFEVLHDGQPVAISNFAEVRAGVSIAAAELGPGAAASAGGPPGTDASIGASTRATPATSTSVPSHVVLYFDQSRLHPGNYAPLIEGLQQLLDAEGVEPQRVLVLRQDRSSLSIAAPFGSSRKELARALDQLADGMAIGLDLDKEEELAVDSIRAAWEQSQDTVGSAQSAIAGIPGSPGPPGGGGGSPRSVVGGAGSGPGAGGGPDACGPFLDQIRPILDGSTRMRSQRIAVTLDNLSTTAGFLAGLPGVKTLLYLSDSLETQPGAALANYAMGLCPAGGADLLTSAMAEEMTARFVELTRHANSNRVTIYSIQAGGLRGSKLSAANSGSGTRGDGGSRARGGFESSKHRTARDGLILIASETGGRAVFDKNALGPELGRIGREIHTYYSLAYEPPKDGETRDHRIEVKIRDRSLTTRYRRGYLEKDPTRWLAERIEGALNLGITDNPLAIRLGVGDVVAGAGATLRLPLHVMVPVESLAFLPRDGSSVAEITVQVMARKFNGDALVTREQSFRVMGSPGASGSADLTVVLELDEGTYLSAVGVQDIATRESSFVSTVLQVNPGG
jgi:VWFA-related protein